jgi:cell division initiation protein
MSITPADIEKKTFSTALRGYDLDEVDDFLDEMVVAFREIQEELAAAKDRVAQLEGDPEALAAVSASAPPAPDESAVGRALVAAQTAADRMLEEAQVEADKIVGDARSEADTFAQERDQKKAEVDAEMAEMTALVAGVRNQLAVLATTVADKLDEMDAVVAGAHSKDSTETETDTGTVESGEGEDVGAEQEVIEETSEGEAAAEEGESDGESGLEVDLEELESPDLDQDDDAGSAEVEGDDAGGENPEI